MKKHIRSTSLKYYILLPLIIIILFQAAVFAGIIITSASSDSLDQNSFQIVNNTVTTRGVSLEQRFSDFINMEDFYDSVTDMAVQNAAALRLDITQYTADAENRLAFLSDVFPVILRALRKSGVTSCFIMLEGDPGNPQKDCIWLRDFNPFDSPESNSDLMTEAGPSQLLYDNGLTLSSFWTPTLDVRKNCPFYQTAFDGGNRYPQLDAMELGYFSTPVSIHPYDRPCITYAIPLLDENHHSYGVIGFDITIDYIKKLLPGQELTLDEYGCYYLGITDNFKTMETVLVVNDSYFDSLAAGSTVTLSPANPEFDIYGFYEDGLRENTCACLYPLRLYTADSPYYSQQWVLGGLLRHDMLHAASNRMNTAVFGAIGLSLLLSLTGTLVITHILMRPIRMLVKEIPKLMPGYGTLPRTRVREFDNLSAAVEEQNASIYRLGNKMADIIGITGVPLGVFEISPADDMAYCTEGTFEILGISHDGWEHNHIPKTLLLDRISHYTGCFEQSHETPDVYRYHRPGYEAKWLEIKRVAKPESTIVTVFDVTESTLEKEKIIHDRDYDILTGLFNRRAFSREMRYMIDEGHCENGVLSIWDLDNLKYTNDTYGHEIGDKYICTLSNLLKKELPEKSISARLSGDEFTMFLYDEPREKLVRILKDIHRLLMLERLKLPDGLELNMSASAGMAFYSQDASNYAELLKYADFAMYQIKKSSKGSIKAYNKDSYLKDYILVQGVGELDRIIMNESIKYAYQPIVSVRTGSIFAYEALIRPISDLLGRPDNLLRVAEAQFKLDKIERLTWFHGLKGFFDQVRDGDNARIFINSIPNQLLPDEDWQALEDLYGSRLGRIVMEITEGAKSDGDINEKKRAFCSKWNIPVALDDYGSGYSNSDQLVSRMFHFVKLDMALIQGIDKNPSTQSLVRSTIDYCHENSLLVISEGIETQEEYDTVKELGTDFVQGYLLAKPSFNLYPE